MKKDNKKANTKILFLIGSFICVIFLLSLFMYRNKTPDRIPPAFVPQEQLNYEQKVKNNCPFDRVMFDFDGTVKSDEYNVKSWDCAVFEFTKIQEGETAVVEIYTSNMETGVQEFQSWLTKHGLQESSKLNIEYIHKSNQ